MGFCGFCGPKPTGSIFRNATASGRACILVINLTDGAHRRPDEDRGGAEQASEDGANRHVCCGKPQSPFPIKFGGRPEEHGSGTDGAGFDEVQEAEASGQGEVAKRSIASPAASTREKVKAENGA